MDRPTEVRIDGVDPRDYAEGSVVEMDDLDELVIVTGHEVMGTHWRLELDIKNRGKAWTNWIDTAKLPKDDA
jgi:hypothetical protein